MALDLDLSDLASLDKVRAVLSRNDPRSQFTPLGTAEIVVAPDALDDLVGIVARHVPQGARRVRLMVDPVTIRRDGADVKARVERDLSDRFDVERVVLDDGQAVLHAEAAILDTATQAVRGADCIVSVGGGTITDIAKVAAERAGIATHVVVQTAASVDGFTDNVSVVLKNGVKKTLPSRWPEAVIADVGVVCEAPHVLTASGFGELLSIYSAPGDWLVAAQMGMDDTFAPILVDILAMCGEGVEEWASGIPGGGAVATERLARALAMRGIVTGVGGTTASLSGMEHLFSHMLDMVHGERHEAMGLHGAQVGVGCVIRAAAWEEFADRMERRPVAAADLFPDIDAQEDEVRAAFATLDPTGRIGEECWSRYRDKLVRWHAARPQVEAALADWPALRDRHDAITLDAARIAALLHRAGAAKRSADLDPAPDAALNAWVVGKCQFMRERFTVADLLRQAGWWDDDGVSRVLARVEAACAAAEEGAP